MTMSHDTERTMFQVDEDVASPSSAAFLPGLKTWVTPKVIVGTVDETETGPGGASDNSAAS
jgi:hypothetical protein